MGDNESYFQIMLQAMLDKAKSIFNIKADIKTIEPKLPKVKLQGTLNKTATQKELNSKIKSIKPKIKVDADTTQAEKKIKKIGKQKNKTTITPTVDNSQVISGLKQAQKETKTLWERFTSGIIGANLVRMAVQRVTQAIREAIATVKELDTIKTNIQMVSGTSDLDVNAMMSSYNAMAKGLSSTTKDVAEAANEFLRMGESIQNTNELIRSSQILSKVGMIESADAASYLISSLKGYNVAAEDSLDIVSKLTSVDLEAAVSAGGLAEAISRCSNIANSSGTSLDRLIGYTAAVGEVTQESMSVIGNAFKSIYSRMNNIKIGRFIDEETGESLSDTEAVLNKLGIQLRDTTDTYRNFDDVLNDIGTRWKDFTQVEQNAISVAVAGTMQRNRFLVLMDNWTKALEYSEVATNSASSALERYGVYQDSIEAKTNELTAALESLSTNTISEGLYSGIIEATTGIVEFLDKTNLLKASLTGLVAMGVTKAIASIGAGFITAAKSTAQLSAAMALFNKGKSEQNLLAIGAACKGLSNQQLKLILSTKTLKYEDRELILAGMGVAETEQKQMLTTLGFAAAEDKATVSTFSLKGAMKSLWATMAANPVGWIVTVVTVATMAFTGFNKAMEEVRQKAKELGDSFKSTKSDIESYKSQIEDLHKTINDSKSSIEDVTNARQTLMSVQDELIDKFGAEKENIDLITLAINNQSDALDTLVEKQWQVAKNDFNKSGFWNSIANWSQGYDTNIDRMVDEMENVREILSFSYNDVDSKKFQELEQLLKQRGWSYQGTLGGFVKEGHLKEIYSEILEIQMLAEDIEAPDHFLKDLTKDANAAKETLDSYGEMWDNYILNDRVFANEDLADSWHKVNEAYSDYHDAFVSGNQEEIDKSLSNYAELMSSVFNDSDVDESVKEYFRDMYPALQAEVEKWEFHAKILPEYDTHALNGMTKLDILGMLQTDGMQYGEQTFNSILNLASDYGIVTGDNAEKVQQLLDLLVEWGILQDDINESTAEYATGTKVSLSISDTISQLNTQLKPAFDSLKSAYQSIFTSDGYNPNAVDIPMLDSIKSSIEEINKLEDVDITIDMDAFDTLATTLTDINTTEEQAKQAFNDFATSIFYATNATDGMTEETKALVEQLLESIGIVNATEVAEYALAEAKAKDMLATYDVINAKEEEYSAILAEGTAAGIAREQLYKLMAAEIAFGNNDLNTEQKIEQLRNLAKAYGDTAGAALATAIANDLASGHADVDSAINDLMAQVNSGIQKVDIDFSPIEKSAAKAGKDAGKSYADTLKDELSNLNSVISYIGDTIDDQIDLFEDQKDAAVEALEAEKEAAEEALEAEKELVQEKIDAKRAEVDAIKDARIERENEFSLQKSQYEWQRMLNQRNILQFSEVKGIHFVQDTKGAREAKEKFDEAKENIQIAGMEKEISGLNDIIDSLGKKIEESNEYYDELIEQTEKYWDGLIKGLEEYKSRWQELADIEEQAKMEVMLRNHGITTEDILNMSGSAFESFRGTYLGLLNEMYSGNDEMRNMLQMFGGMASDTLKPLSGTIGTVARSLDDYAASAGMAGTKTSVASENVGTLSTNTSELNGNLSGVSDNINDILEDNKLETIAEQIGDVAESVQSVADALNDMPTEMDIGGITEQFDALGNSVDKVSASISGGNASKSDTSDTPSGKNAYSAESNSGGNGVNSLVSSIKEVKSETDKSIGTGDDSGAIGQFNQLGESVMDVTTAIGGSDGSENTENLISSIENLGETTTETLGDPDGDGAIGRFGEFGDTVAEAEGHVNGIIDGMNELDGMTAECTIKVNVETNGSIPAFSEGTVNTDFESGEFTAQYGKAFAEGTGKYHGLPRDEKNALVSEYGQTEMTVLPNGDTIITDEPTLMDLPKDTVIYNEEQTKKIMDNKVDAGGKAHADGTDDSIWTTLADGTRVRDLQPGDKMYDLMKKVNVYLESIDYNMEKLVPNSFYEHQKQMADMAKQITNNSVINNIAHNRNVQQPVTVNQNITLNCPNVTNNSGIEYIQKELGNLSQRALQESMKR